MNDLVIDPTKTTFGIYFDSKKGNLEIFGNSYPNNPIEFFKPILNWIKEFTKTRNDPITLRFNVNYYNTSSSNYIYKMLEMIESYKKNGNKTEIIYLYYEGEEDMLDSWNEIMDELNLSCTIEQA